MSDSSSDDRWTTTVHPRGWITQQHHVLQDEGLCSTGMPHEFASGECVTCGAEDPNEDRPTLVHPYDTRDAHVCFAGCRHARTRDGRYLRPRPDWDDG